MVHYESEINGPRNYCMVDIMKLNLDMAHIIWYGHVQKPSNKDLDKLWIRGSTYVWFNFIKIIKSQWKIWNHLNEFWFLKPKRIPFIYPKKKTLENFTYNTSVKFIRASVSFKSNGEESATFSWEIFSNDLFINPISEVAFPLNHSPLTAIP